MIAFAQGFVTVGYAQHSERKIDSLKIILESEKDANARVDLMNEISVHFRFVQVDKGLEYAANALRIAEKNDYIKGKATSNYNLGASYFYRGDYKKSLGFYSKALELQKKIKDKKAISNTMAAISSVYFTLGEYNRSLEIYNRILQEYRSEKNTIGIAQTYSNIGTLFSYQNDDKKALEYYLKSEAEFKKASYTVNNFYTITLTNIGLIYYDLNEFKKAEKYFLESMEINNKIGNLFMVAKNLCSLGDIHLKQKNYKYAEQYHNQSLKIGKQMNNQEVIAYNYGDLGRIYYEQALEQVNVSKKKGITKKSIDFLKVSTETFKSNGNVNSYQQYSKYLADAYKANGDYESALEIFQQHSIYKDSLFNEEKRKAFTRTELSFEFAKREDSIRLESEKQIAIRDATLRANTRQKWLLFAGVLLLSVIGILLYYQNRIRRKNNERLYKLNQELNEANQIKARFFSIINHDLRSPVSNIIKFIRLQQNQNFILDESTRQRLEEQTVSSAENLLVSMEDLLLWSKGQMDNFQPQFKKTKLEELFNDFKQYFEALSSVEIKFLNPDNLVIETDEEYLKTIMRNLTSNSLKALENIENPHITWKACAEDNKKIISISDNGLGGSSEQFRALYDEKHTVGIHTGLGLHLVRDMAKAIDCKISVSTTQGVGTTISLEF